MAPLSTRIIFIYMPLFYASHLLGRTQGTLFIDDAIHFRMNWRAGDTLLEEHILGESLKIKSSNNENYICVLPNTTDDDKESTGSNGKDMDHESAKAIIAKLHSHGSCSYRMESYWTYELCHGKHIRQYHDETDANTKTRKLTEYFMGHYVESKQGLDQSKTNSNSEPQIKTKHVDSKDLPYYEVLYTDGTHCDLTNKPRSAKVLYVCHEQGFKNEILMKEEPSTCEYEFTVITTALCSHHAYKPKEKVVQDIMCYPESDDAPIKPRRLSEIEKDGSTLPGTPNIRGMAEEIQINEDDEGSDDGGDDVEYQEVMVEVIENGVKTQRTVMMKTGKVVQKPAVTLVKPEPDKEMMKLFLRGEHCLHGGSGYWRYEICYGKHVIQYHEETNRLGKKVKGALVHLGYWNEDKHKDYISRLEPDHADKVKARAQQQRYIKHIYMDGDVCDVTGKPRSVTVKLKCLSSDNMNQVSLSLSEPQTCEYILVVESPIICELLDYVDDFGIPHVDIEKL